jgi:anti-sigma factor RsiW
MTEPITGGRPTPAPIDCETAVRRLWHYIDGRLATMARDDVDAHLATCEGCPPHFAFARTMRGALASIAPAPAGTEDEARLRVRVRVALTAARIERAAQYDRHDDDGCR